MARLFLSGQTTCALLLGAGLLLRAQAALQREPEVAQHAPVDPPKTHPAELFGPQTVHARAPRIVRSTEAAPAGGNARTHPRKSRAQRQARKPGRACGVRVASKGFRCG